MFSGDLFNFLVLTPMDNVYTFRLNVGFCLSPTFDWICLCPVNHYLNLLCLLCQNVGFWHTFYAHWGVPLHRRSYFMSLLKHFCAAQQECSGSQSGSGSFSCQVCMFPPWLCEFSPWQSYYLPPSNKHASLDPIFSLCTYVWVCVCRWIICITCNGGPVLGSAAPWSGRNIGWEE